MAHWLNLIQVKDWFSSCQRKIKNETLKVIKHFKGDQSKKAILKYEVANTEAGIKANVTLDTEVVKTLQGFEWFEGHPRTIKQSQNQKRTKPPKSCLRDP